MFSVAIDGTAIQVGNGSVQANYFPTTPGTRIDVSTDDITFVDTEVAADALRKIERAWVTLIASNVACTCCSSDLEYISRVNDVADIIGRPHWNGK